MSKVILDAAHFDSKARQWDENPVFQERARRIAEAMRAMVPLSTTMTALDYGSGTGLLSFPLRNELGFITLSDTSAGMLAVVEEKIAALGVTNMATLLADLSATSLPDARFDLIYSSMTLHHIPDTDAILTAFHAHLNPGGWLAIADLDREDGSFHGAEVDVHHGFERDVLAERVRRAGFVEVAFRTVFEIGKEQPQGMRVYPVFIMVARRA
ncbi:MAG TPA: class I SAM-dependent methyltransferase [Thiobacillaceae bacterium]|nr:class I SAM-dependent methyltransferase [Thiobacillaceae bacterium]HNU64085.1 class I SAM-dependent methyltransferase [Thiobacillaceae bacterium]